MRALPAIAIIMGVPYVVCDCIAIETRESLLICGYEKAALRRLFDVLHVACSATARALLNGCVNGIHKRRKEIINHLLKLPFIAGLESFDSRVTFVIALLMRHLENLNFFKCRSFEVKLCSLLFGSGKNVLI